MKFLNITVIVFILVSNLNCRPFLAERFNQSAQKPESKPDQIIEILKKEVKPDSSIVDLGAGGGYFSLRFAKEVVPDGTVYAVDIEKEYLNYIDDLAKKQNIKNIKLILAKEEDSMLSENIADLIFIRNVYHHINQPEKYFFNLKSKLKPDGKIVIIDYTLEHAPISGLKKHGVEPSEIKNTMQNTGYQLLKELDILPEQSFLIFKK